MGISDIVGIEVIREEVRQMVACMNSITDEMDKGLSSAWIPYLLGQMGVHLDRVEKELENNFTEKG
jgi:hypothetical protein